MIRRDPELEALRAEWLAPDGGATERHARQLARARRAAVRRGAAESAIALVALLIVAAALRHAANALEAALGIVVAVAIAAVWAQQRRLARREQASLEATSVAHLATMRAVRAGQARLAQFVWIVLALDLVFLIPWWIIGSRVHSRRLTDVGSLVTMWLPLLGMLALVVWAARRRRAALREAAALDALLAAYRREA